VNRQPAMEIYPGQFRALRDHASGRLSTDEFADAFWDARYDELGPDQTGSHTLDAILDPGLRAGHGLRGRRSADYACRNHAGRSSRPKEIRGLGSDADLSLWPMSEE